MEVQRTPRRHMLALDEQYSCRFCKFIQKTIGFDDLSKEEEENYIVHMKTIHEISR